MRRILQRPWLASDPVGCLGNFLFFSVPIEQNVHLRVYPILQKNQFAALARLVFIMCGAESCFYYGVLPDFVLVMSIYKAFAVPSLLFAFKSVGYGFSAVVRQGVRCGGVTVRHTKVLPRVGWVADARSHAPVEL